MKKTIYLLFVILLFISCNKQPELKITVENPSDFDRDNELVEIPIEKFSNILPLSKGQAYLMKDETGEIIPYQLTADAKLIFQAKTKAKTKKVFTLLLGEPQSFKAKTYCRFIKERKDDFAWENDRVAFRVYGPALIETDGPSNGIDLWYKRTNNLVIDQWYKTDLAGIVSYHNDNGEGLDNYKVGRTLGAGGMAPYIEGKLWLNENFVSQEVIDNGPLRSTFRLSYKKIDINGKEISETRLFSIDAGSQLTKVVEEYGTSDPITVAAGIIKRQEGDSLTVSPDKHFVAYNEPKTRQVDGIYIGLVFPSSIDSTKVDTYTIENKSTGQLTTFSHYLVIKQYEPDSPVIYYTGYGWNKFGFADAEAFQTYLKNFSNALKNPLVVTIQ